jgi:hypothetical protein
MTELILNTGEFIDQSDLVHDVILNRLDLLHTNNGKSFVYDADEFRNALPLFLEAPWVFAGVHPKNIGKLPMEDALKEVEGRVVGTLNDAVVNDAGTLFRGKVKITDPEVNELVRTGKALLSTAFSATPDDKGVLRNIVPNHILVYPAEPGAPAPGDHAALFLNQTNENNLQNGDKTMVDETKDKELDLVRELVTNQAARDELQNKLTEQSELVFNQKTQLDEKDRIIAEKDASLKQKDEVITNQTTEVENLKTEVTKLSGTINEIKLNTKKAKRDNFFNQFLAGTQKAFEPRKAEIYDDEKSDDLFAEMFAHQANVKEPPKDVSGNEDVQNQDKDVLDEKNAESAWELSEVRL